VTERDATLCMLIRLGREAFHGGRCRVRCRPGDLIVEISRYEIDPDGIGWLVNHGRAPYEADAPPGATTREVWDMTPLSGRTGQNGGEVRWENADFVALPEAIADLAREAFPRHVEIARQPCLAVRDRAPCELVAGHEGEHSAGDRRWR
jgi:hypothetical protein